MVHLPVPHSRLRFLERRQLSRHDCLRAWRASTGLRVRDTMRCPDCAAWAERVDEDERPLRSRVPLAATSVSDCRIVRCAARWRR